MSFYNDVILPTLLDRVMSAENLAGSVAPFQA
jgi:hypothetical protein